MSDQLLGFFKVCLLILLYLFFARVLWAVWSEVRRAVPSASERGATTAAAGVGGGGRGIGQAGPPPTIPDVGSDTRPDPEAPPRPTAPRAKPSRRERKRQAAAGMKGPGSAPATTKKAAKGRRGHVARMTVLEPKQLKGATFALSDEITIGRGDGCTVRIPDDTFVSHVHCRVFRVDDRAYVEDLGSTNGSFLNGSRLTTALQLHPGDRLQLGSTVLEAG